MPPSPHVIDWLNRTYPKPRVDPEWLDACYNWVTTELNLNPATDLQKLIQNVESQLLQSDLRDSMLHGTGLPTNISQLDHTILRGPHVLVEIVSMTEIGVSALSLSQTMQTRMERMAAGEGEEGDGDVDVEGEGPVPKYPRGMLRFELSDGATTLQAIEYRMLPELTLGVTPLGYKMLLKDVLVRRGIAFLEPKCVVMKGHQTEDRELLQAVDFARGLRLRLGLPDPEPEDTQPANAAPSPSPAPVPHQNVPLPHLQNPRSPLRTLSRPPSPKHNNPQREDEEDQPRRRRIPNPTPTSTSASSSTVVQSSYFSSTTSSKDTTGGPVGLILSPVRSGPILIEIDDDDNVEMGGGGSTVGGRSPSLEGVASGSNRIIELDCREDERRAKGAPESQKHQASAIRDVKGKGKAVEDVLMVVGDVTSDSDYGGDEINVDEALLAGLDRAEMEALGSRAGGVSDLASTSVFGARRGSFESSESEGGKEKGRGVVPTDVEVITIDDEEEDEKENVPVPTRHVKRRIGPSASERQPMILASDSDDIIDISDSDSV